MVSETGDLFGLGGFVGLGSRLEGGEFGFDGGPFAVSGGIFKFEQLNSLLPCGCLLVDFAEGIAAPECRDVVSILPGRFLVTLDSGFKRGDFLLEDGVLVA